MERLTFDYRRVESRTPAALRAALEAGAGPIAVLGRPGTGRSTAVEEAVNGHPMLRLSMGSGGARSATSLRQAAATLGDPALLHIYVERGLTAAIEQVEARVGDGLVVIDDADPLLMHAPETDSWLDAVPGMLAPDDATWLDWVRSRRGSTVLIGQRSIGDFRKIFHQRNNSEEWPVKLRHAEGGHRDWPNLARRLGDRLDLHYFARFVAQLLPADTFNVLVWNTHQLDDVFETFGRVFRAGAGRLVRALDVIHSLDGASESVVRAALAAELPRDDDRLEPTDLLSQLRRERLVSVSGPTNGQDGVVRPLPILAQCGAVHLLSESGSARLAQALVRTVNDPQELDPTSAAIVLAAHELAVRAGLTDVALQTAVLHVHGLISLARRLSFDESDYLGAWRLYDRMEPMVRPRGAADRGHDRVRSYVLNYRAYNGLRAGQLDAASALTDAAEATSLWPENARWQGQRIELLLRLGRVADALRAVEEAEASKVAWHPQRARHLRVSPARAAVRVGLLQPALQLLELRQPQWLDDEEARSQVQDILRRCERGVEVTDLASPTHRLVFRGRQQCTLTRLVGEGRTTWTASVQPARLAQTEREPEAALAALVDAAAAELAGLLGTPTPWLRDAYADRKGELLSHIDVIHSDLGLEFAEERWFVGRVEEEELVLMDTRVGPSIPLAEGVSVPAGGKGLWFGRAPVDRAGFPTGPVIELRRAGSGRTAQELREALEALWGAESA